MEAAAAEGCPLESGVAAMKVIPDIIPQRAEGERRRSSPLPSQDEEGRLCDVSSVCCPCFVSFFLLFPSFLS